MTSSQSIVAFGAGALLVFAAVYFFYDRFDRRKASSDAAPVAVRPFNITFARLFGLLTVAVLGVGLALNSSADKELAASAFTLLGTVAGYLAGAKATTTPAPPGGAAGGQGQPDDSGTPSTALAQEHL